MKTIFNKEEIRGIVAGVYMIREVDTDRVYVGSANGLPSNGIQKRWSNHEWCIENGYSKYFDDLNKMRFEILEVVPNDASDEELSELEVQYFQYVQRVGFELVNRNKKVATRHKVSDTSNMKAAQRGSNNPRARLTEQDVMEILYLREQGYDAKEIAERYNLKWTYIYKIGKEKWLHITEKVKPAWLEDVI